MATRKTDPLGEANTSEADAGDVGGAPTDDTLAKPAAAGDEPVESLPPANEPDPVPPPDPAHADVERERAAAPRTSLEREVSRRDRASADPASIENALANANGGYTVGDG